MKPYFTAATRDPVRDIQTLQTLLNRDAFRTQHIVTPVDTLRSGETVATYYTDVHWPFEDGEVIRRARFMIPTDFRISTGGASVTVALGLRSLGQQDETTFRLLGTAWDSRSHAYVVGTPFTLLRDETKIPSGSGVVVRVQRLYFTSPLLLGAVVETSIGYQGVS